MASAIGEAKGPPRSIAHGRLTFFTAFAGALVAAALASDAGRAQEVRVDIQVFNPSFKAIEVRIYDVVCQQVIFDGEILDTASVPVQACADQDGRATIAVEDHFGQRQTYPGLSDPSTVELAFQA